MITKKRQQLCETRVGDMRPASTVPNEFEMLLHPWRWSCVIAQAWSSHPEPMWTTNGWSWDFLKYTDCNKRNNLPNILGFEIMRHRWYTLLLWQIHTGMCTSTKRPSNCWRMWECSPFLCNSFCRAARCPIRAIWILLSFCSHLSYNDEKIYDKFIFLCNYYDCYYLTGLVQLHLAI